MIKKKESFLKPSLLKIVFLFIFYLPDLGNDNIVTSNSSLIFFVVLGVINYFCACTAVFCIKKLITNKVKDKHEEPPQADDKIFCVVWLLLLALYWVISNLIFHWKGGPA
jgi:hypothetical protein